MDLTEILELLKPLLAVVGAIFGAIIGSYLASRWALGKQHKLWHFDRLRQEVLEPWIREMRTKFGDLEYNLAYEGEKIVASHRSRTSLEQSALFEDVLHHFPRLSEEWQRFAVELFDYGENCLTVADEIEKEVREKTRMQVRAGYVAGAVAPQFVLLAYNRLIKDQGGGEPPQRVPQRLIIREQVMSSGRTLYSLRDLKSIYAVGAREEMERSRRTYQELSESDRISFEANKLLAEANELKTRANEVESLLQEIVERAELPGKCRFMGK